MFTGLIACTAPIKKAKKKADVIDITLTRPPSFKNLKTGDSLSVDGICLTLEKLNKKEMSFTLAHHTLKTTKWKLQNLPQKTVNLELSMTLKDRLHGHLVTGHIDGMAKVQKIIKKGRNKLITLQLPKGFEPFLIKKGCLAINGVSLTIQELLSKNQVSLGLIPETLKRTNLNSLRAGDRVCFEICYIARLLYKAAQKRKA